MATRVRLSVRHFSLSAPSNAQRDLSLSPNSALHHPVLPVSLTEPSSDGNDVLLHLAFFVSI